MKKFFAFLFCIVLTAAAALGLSACSEDSKDEIHVYAPDGAPALALAYSMALDDELNFGKDVDYEIVDSSTIQTFVTGNSPRADICILPVNLASHVLGSGEKYKLLGTVTHGNLFILKKEGAEDIADSSDLAKLKGKKVGVVNLGNVPGLTLKAILKDNDIKFEQANNTDPVSADKVGLINISEAATVAPALGYDYYVVPEPAASGKAKATTLSFTAANLQSLYGDSGYPQAVVVAKNSIVNNNAVFVKKFVQTLTEGAEWLKYASAERAVNIINDKLTDGMKPSLNANNLTSQVILNCAVKYEGSASCMQSIKDYMTKIRQAGAKFNMPDDGFFYEIV